MSDGCRVCETIAEKHDDLICDDCLITCAMCERSVCPEHVSRLSIMIDRATNKRKRTQICIDCATETYEFMMKTKRLKQERHEKREYEELAAAAYAIVAAAEAKQVAKV